AGTIVVEQLIVLSVAVGDEQIDPSIVIVIRPGNRPRSAEIVDNTTGRDFGKRPIALIMEKEILKIGLIDTIPYYHIHKTIIVVVTPRDAARIVVIANDGANG